ncbi:RNA polymerase sigma factor [Verrucomicrobiota bacterium]
MEELVGLALAGDASAFERLVENTQDVVFGLAYQQTRNRADAEDVAQETFCRAYRNLKKLRRPGSFAKWVCGIAVNVAKQHARRRKPTVPLDFIGAPASGEESTEEQTDADMILEMVAKLPAKYRIPLTLRYVKGLNYGQIGEALGVVTVTARSHVHRARAMIRDMLDRSQE